MKKFLSTLMGIFLCSYVSVVSATAPNGVTNKPKEQITKKEPKQKKKEDKKSPFENRYTDLSKKLMPTVVSIHVSSTYLGDDYNEYKVVVSGSGVFISENGHILTCAHLFDQGEIKVIEITKHNDDVMVAELLYIDYEKDLALLKIYFDEETQYAKVSEQNPKVGEFAIAIGHPLGFLTWTFTTGVISGIDRSLYNNQDLIQTDAVINRGSSGGPLFDIEGNIIGINVLMVNSYPIPNWSGQGFAVSTEELRKFLDKFKGL